MFLKFLYIDMMIKNNQNGIAKVNEKIICLEDEKIYGKSLNKLLNKININKLINIIEGDFRGLFLYNIIISLLRIFVILFNNQLIRLGKIHKKFGIKIIII